MAGPTLIRLDLSGDICVENGCSDLVFNDTTGFLVAVCSEDQNNNGYGLVGGIAVTDVQLAILNVYFPNVTTPIKFTFTVTGGTITDATLTDVNLVVTNIFSILENTLFPITDFNVMFNYGVTIPSLIDGTISWDYTISGSGFFYTTSGTRLSDCLTDCCIANSYLKIDTSCDCSKDKLKNIMLSEILLNASKYSMNIGQDAKANDFISKAKEFCDSNCKTC